jgi:uncharacterized protein YkwD
MNLFDLTGKAIRATLDAIRDTFVGPPSPPGPASKAMAGDATPAVPPPPVVPATPPRFDPPADTTSALALHRAINSARMSHGRPTLDYDPVISPVAAAWAARMARTGRLDHGDFAARIASVKPGRAAGEDIGRGYPTAADEVAGWLNSSPHRSILLGAYTSVGVGVGVGRDGSLWWVADFVR